MNTRILIIEDNPDNLELMTCLLKAFGHEPLVACNGDEGLATARGEKPELIVCDIQLSGMDGYTIARLLKADPTTRAIPLLAVTALAMVGDRDKVLAAGFDGYISKPIDPESFVPQVEAFLAPEQRSSRLLPTAIDGAATTPAAQIKRCTILVVDDLPVNLDLKRSILEPAGYTVLTANGMGQALVMARHTPPNLIVSDLGMSDGSGFDFIMTVKSDPLLKGIPIVFISSSYRDEASRSRGLAVGAVRFLIRPLDPDVLLAEVEACLREGKGH